MGGTLAQALEVLGRRRADLDAFFTFHRDEIECPLFTSIDVRRNRDKAAAVDANAFPSGFNNLSERSRKDAASALAGSMRRRYPSARDVLIIAESHTRNRWYFQNLRAMRDLFRTAGYRVTLGTLAREFGAKATLRTPRGHQITLHRVTREGDALTAAGRRSDVVVLNNDLSSVDPALFAGLGQPVTPSPAMGWQRRRKSEHFGIVAGLVAQLAAEVDVDPWLLSAEFDRVGGVDFSAGEGLDRVAAAADRVLDRVRSKHEEYGIERAPVVFVKPDAGTYGIGITTATSGDEILALSRRRRDRLAVGKEGAPTRAVIVQEGVQTEARRGAATAEPVVYMVCGRVVGGFYRIHDERGPLDNLNAPGSRFEPFVTRAVGRPGPDEIHISRDAARLFRVLGDLASIATGYEARLAMTVGAGASGTGPDGTDVRGIDMRGTGLRGADVRATDASRAQADGARLPRFAKR
jgi:glutamate--cysteine ligase